MHNCLQCHKTISKKGNKFCNHSCSATYTNKQRIENGWKLSEESKNKIGSSIKKNNKNITNYICRQHHIEYRICVICKKLYTCRDWSTSKTCKSEKCKIDMKLLTGNKVSELNGYKNKWKWKCKSYISKLYGTMHMDSEWECILAKSLEDNNIKWERPKFFNWIDEKGKSRKYFPDFYLPDYDIYIDPKNPYLYSKDKYKLDYVRTTHNIKLCVVTDYNLLTWNHIKSFI